jgi:hypothetical protein
VNDSVETLIAYCRQDGRVCPQPIRWNELWEMLPNRTRIGSGWMPPLPLILAAWHEASALARCCWLKSTFGGLSKTGHLGILLRFFAVYAKRIGITQGNEGQFTMTEPRILQLNLKREFFAEIVVGKKPLEYRDRTDYWKTRLEGREYEIIRFRNGYGPEVPEMDVEWIGVEKRRDCYAIRLGKIIRLKHWPV